MNRKLLAVGLTGAAMALCALARLDVKPVRAADSTLTWEAEDAQQVEDNFKRRRGTKTDRKPRPDRNSGAGYVEIPDKANGHAKEEDSRSSLPGVARFKVRVTATGQYNLWGRVLWPNGCGNSFWVRANGGPKQLLGEDGTYDSWHWVQLQGPKLSLRAGEQTIEVLNREDGVLLDEVQVTTSGRVPQGIQPPTSGALVK